MKYDAASFFFSTEGRTVGLVVVRPHANVCRPRTVSIRLRLRSRDSVEQEGGRRRCWRCTMMSEPFSYFWMHRRPVDGRGRWRHEQNAQRSHRRAREAKDVN